MVSLDIIRRAEIGELKNMSINNQLNRNISKQKGNVPTVDELLDVYYGRKDRGSNDVNPLHSHKPIIQSKHTIDPIDIFPHNDDDIDIDDHSDDNRINKNNSSSSKTGNTGNNDRERPIGKTNTKNEKVNNNDSRENSKSVESVKDNKSNDNNKNRDEDDNPVNDKGSINAEEEEEQEEDKEKNGSVHDEAEEAGDEEEVEEADEEEEEEEDGGKYNVKNIEMKKVSIEVSHARRLYYRSDKKKVNDGKSYVVIRFPGDILVSTKVSKSSNPIWNEKLTSNIYYNSKDSNTCKIYVFEDDQYPPNYNKSIGMYEIDMNNMNNNTGRWYGYEGKLYKDDSMVHLDQYDYIGHIYFCMVILDEKITKPIDKPVQKEDYNKTINSQTKVSGEFIIKVGYIVGLIGLKDNWTKDANIPKVYYELVLPDGSDIKSSVSNEINPVCKDGVITSKVTMSSNNYNPVSIILYEQSSNNNQRIAQCDIPIDKCIEASNKWVLNGLCTLTPYKNKYTNISGKIHVKMKYRSEKDNKLDNISDEPQDSIPYSKISSIGIRGYIYIKMIAYRLPIIDKMVNPTVHISYPVHSDIYDVHPYTRSTTYYNTCASEMKDMIVYNILSNDISVCMSIIL